MKAFVIASLFIASCSASYYGAISSQYQSQDGHGGYSYGYSDPLSTKHESKTHDGSLHGGYSYVDAHGHVQSVKYVADPHHGFQIVSATNLPKGPAPVHAVYAPAVSHWDVPAYAPYQHGAPLPVQKTPEVLAAEHKHFAAVAEAKARLHHHHKRSVGPVDTPEVQHEKQIHFAAHQRALQGLPANPILYHPQLAQPSAHYAPAPQYAHAPAYYNNKHYEQAPAPVNGVPQDTAEVAHAKANHLALVAHAKAQAPAHYGPAHYEPAHYEPSYNAPAKYAPEAHYGPWKGPIHIPVIHNGVPEETPEVKAAKSKHFSLVHEAQAHQGHQYAAPAYYGQEDDGSYDAKKYENESYY